MNLDLEKPNFIFSSDIQSKAIFLAKRYKRKLRPSFDDGHDSEVDAIEISTSSTSFTLNVELNTLLLRNRMLRASDLVKENLISIANDSRKQSNRCLSRPLQSAGVYVHRAQSSTETDSAKSDGLESLPLSQSVASGFGLSLAIFNLSTKNDEIFIVSLNLKVLELVVTKEGDEYSVSLDFFKDESYGILVLCDFGFVDQIEYYVKRKLIHEITTLPDSRELSDESDDEEAVNSVFNLDISIDEDRNTSIDTHSLSSTANEEEFLKIDSPEKDFTSPPGIQSGDITRLNTLDVVESEGEISDEGDEADMMFAQGVLLNNKPILIKEDDEFLTELDNLRHNEHSPGRDNHVEEIEDEEEEVVEANMDHLNLESLDILTESDCNLVDISSPKQSPITTSRVKSNISKFDLPSYLPALQPPIEILRKPTPPDGYVLPPSNPPSLPPPPTKIHSLGFISPRRGRELSKKPLTGTFSTIHDEDTSELEYAFRDRSPTVPSYIKQNKKFKFIKVGKVQKFVHLFEEKKPEPSIGDLAQSLRHALRQPLRSGSPQRVAST